MSCSTTLSLSASTSDNPMDAAIYHLTRQTIFSVRGGYIFEFSLTGNQLATAKFVNPCFSKSCMAYDFIRNKIWVGTNADWASGRGGDAGSGPTPSLNNALLYRIDPTTLLVDQIVNPNIFAWGGFFFTGAAWVRQMPQVPNIMPFLWGAQSGFYDLLYANNTLWFSAMQGEIGLGPGQSFIGGFDVTNITGNNFLYQAQTTPMIQLTYDSTNSPNRIWVNQLDDLYGTFQPQAVNSDFSPADPSTRIWDSFDLPTGGANGSVVFSSVGGGAVYICQLSGQGLVKYNMDGTVNSVKALAGVPAGGQNVKMRFNGFDSMIYIPFPANNQVVQYNPATDAVSHIYTGLDAPHDCVFSTTKKFAVQLGSVGIKELV